MCLKVFVHPGGCQHVWLAVHVSWCSRDGVCMSGLVYLYVSISGGSQYMLAVHAYQCNRDSVNLSSRSGQVHACAYVWGVFLGTWQCIWKQVSIHCPV